MKIKHTVLSIALSLSVLFTPLSPVNAADLLPPQKAIEVASIKLQDKLQDPNFIKDFNQINQFVNETIYPHTDFDRISALVLGKLWKTATPEEKKRFTHEFQTLLVRSYSRAFVDFKQWSVRFLPLEIGEDANKVIVKTEVLQPGLQPVKVDYRMFLNNGDWKAYDILIEGVSLITNYRSTFANEVQTKGSLTTVIDDLAKRNAEALASKK